jgi:hypothetical protein
VQHHCVASPEGRGIPHTGLGEVWFNSFETAALATITDEWSAVIADADTSMDLGCSSIGRGRGIVSERRGFLTVEHIVDAAAGPKQHASECQAP